MKKIILSVVSLVIMALYIWNTRSTVQKNSIHPHEKLAITKASTQVFDRKIASHSESRQQSKLKFVKSNTQSNLVWKDLGQEYEITKDQWGNLEQLKLKPNVVLEENGKQKFNPMNEKDVLDQAWVILEQYYALLGIQKDFPLMYPKLSQTLTGAQVVFEQTYQDKIIMPHGEVSIVMNDQGQLAGLYSSYRPNVQIGSTDFGSPIAAQQSAIYWIKEVDSKGLAHAEPAYLERKMGESVIRSAQNQAILSVKNTKIY